MAKSLRERWAGSKYYFFLILILHYSYCSSLLEVVSNMEECPAILSESLQWWVKVENSPSERWATSTDRNKTKHTSYNTPLANR